MSGWQFLEGFCERAARDRRLQPTHVSLYLALLRAGGQQGRENTFRISRKELMAVAQISSRVTYHRRMRELHAWGYIHYQPTYDYYRGSLVGLLLNPKTI